MLRCLRRNPLYLILILCLVAVGLVIVEHRRQFLEAADTIVIEKKDNTFVSQTTQPGNKDADNGVGNTFVDLCLNFNTSREMCDKVFVTEAQVDDIYPVQLVSGAPGSGNDWILWLGANRGYHGSLNYLGTHCESYKGINWRRKDADGGLVSDCVFIKTHEPWFDLQNKHYNVFQHVHRAALILRHPFDSAFSDFKRAKAVEKTENNAKMSSDAITLDLYLDSNKKIKNGTQWRSYSKTHIQKWLTHAKFWLENWKGPLHIIIYKDFVSDVQMNLNRLLEYFGFPFDKKNLHRHCCVREHPINSAIKRTTSEIDKYKDYLLDGDHELKKLSTMAEVEVQTLLDNKWPGLYKLPRG